MVNVVRKPCNYDGCYKQPNYNYNIEKKSLYCNTHKLNGMIDVKNKTCIYNGCTKLAIYNTQGQKKVYIVRCIN